MAVERYGSKTDVVVKLILVFFISLLSFSIGTFVGKKFSDNQHKLARMEPAGHDTEKQEHRAVASVNPKSHEIKPEDALTDEEIAKLSEEFAADEDGDTKPVKSDKNSGHPGNEATAQKATGHHPPAPLKETTQHQPAAKPAVQAQVKPSTPSAAAQNLAHNQAPAPQSHDPKLASRIPSSLPKQVAASPVGKFTVQVASYGSETEAQTKAADLKTKGYSAFYVPAKIKGQTWFRVSIGLYSTQKEADTYRRELTAKGSINSAIVQKISAE